MVGGFCLSLDFELMWGVRDTRTVDDYGTNILGARTAIPILLDRFAANRIAATWATVGLLFFDNKDELLNSFPNVRPHYVNRRLSPYSAEALRNVGSTEQLDPYHFGRSLVKLIAAAPRQEVATHTFSHYYCLEPGQNENAFQHDLQAAQYAAAGIGLDLKSIVFPRNQFNPDYLDICREVGLVAFRGNEDSWLYAAQPGERRRMWKRSARFLDSYFDFSGIQSQKTELIGGVVNVPASRFLRPHSKPVRIFDNLRLKRIVGAMRQAAAKNDLFHLWFHPHNFGVNQAENFSFLEHILAEARQLYEKFGWESVTMHEIASRHMLGTADV